MNPPKKRLHGIVALVFAMIFMAAIIKILTGIFPKLKKGFREEKEAIRDWFAAPSIVNIPITISGFIIYTFYYIYTRPTLIEAAIDLSRSVMIFWAAFAVV